MKIKVCTKCGIEKSLNEFYKHKDTKDGFRSQCKTCTLAACKIYRQNNPEKCKQAVKNWIQNNPEKQKKAVKNWNNNNPEKCKQIVRAWYQKNTERNSQTNKKWYKKNLERRKRTVKSWRKNNPEKCRCLGARRRALKLNAQGSFTTQEWLDLKESHGNRCLCCGKPECECKLTIDHIVPLSKGGSNSIDNLQPLCLSCNSSKHTKTIDYRPII